MIHFYPITTIHSLLKAPKIEKNISAYLESAFPNGSTSMVNSGRSAFATILEGYALRGKRIALPAYICDVLAPVLERYNIQVVLYDLDIDTLCPDITSLDRIYAGNESLDAIVLCPLFGIQIPDSVYALAKQKATYLIVDAAHCTQCISGCVPGQLYADALYLSISKIFPTLDGGITIFLNQATAIPRIEYTRPRALLWFIKRLTQIHPWTKWVVSITKRMIRASNIGNPTFEGIYRMHPLSHWILQRYIKQGTRSGSWCIPVLCKDPELLANICTASGVETARLWENPLYRHKQFSSITDTDVPTSSYLSKHLLCLPYPKTDKDRIHIVNILEKTRPELLTERTYQWQRDILPQTTHP